MEDEPEHIDAIRRNLEKMGEDVEVAVSVRLVPAEDIRAFRLYPPDWVPKEKWLACISVLDTGIGVEPVSRMTTDANGQQPGLR